MQKKTTGDNPDRTQARLRLRAIRMSRLRSAIILVMWLLFSAVATQALFYLFAEPILRVALPKIVEKKSNGVYTASFGHLSVKYTQRSMMLTDFRLLPNHKRYAELKKIGKIKSGLYEIRIPEIEVNTVSSYRLFYFKTLKMKELRVSNPQVRLADLPFNKKKKKEKKYDAVNKDLLPFVTKYIKALEIERIVVDNAYFNMNIGSLDQKTTVANHLTFVLYDFSLNPKNYTKSKDKFLYTKNIDLVVKDYMFALPDHIHILKAKKISISTKTGRLRADQVKIEPIPGLTFTEETKFVNILVPEISLDGFDFKKAYANSIVKVNEFLLKSPEINVYGYKSKKKEELSKPESIKNIKLNTNIDLYKFIKGALKSVEVKYFNLSDAKFNSFPNQKSKEAAISVHQLSIVLNQFVVDSLSQQNHNRILNSAQINLNVHGFQMALADSYHQLKVKRFYVSSKEEVILADEVEIFHPNGTSRKANVKNGFDIFVPTLSMKNIDLHKAYNYNILDIKEFNMNKPVVSMTKFKIDSAKNRDRKPLNDILSHYFTRLKIKNFTLDGGLFEFKGLSDSVINLNSGGRVKLHLSDFLYEPDKAQDTSKLFYAENFELLLNDYSLRLKDKIHNLHFGEMKLSSEQKLFSVEHLSISPILQGNPISILKKNKKNNLLDLSVNEIKCNGLDVRKIYEEKKLYADSIILKRPQIEIRHFDLNFEPRDTSSKLTIDKAYVFGARDSIKTDSLLSKVQNEKKTSPQKKDSIDPKKILSKILDALDDIEIGKVVAKDGSLRTEQNDSAGYAISATNYNFFLKIDQFHLFPGFLKDSINTIPAKDVSLVLKDFEKDIFKDKYRLNLNELGISTSKSLIYAKTLRLQPTRAFAKASDKYMNLYIPDIKLYYQDIKKILATRVLTVDSVIAQSPRLIWIKFPEKDALPFIGDTTTKKRLIPDILKSIDIKHAELNNGMFAAYNEKNKSLKSNKVISFNFDFNIDNLPIDSSFLAKSINKNCQITGVINNALLKTKDSLHYMTADYIYLDTYKQRLDLYGYQLSYNSKLSKFQTISRLENFKKNNLLSIGVEQAHFNGFNWLEAVDKKGMSFDAAAISGLDVKVINYEFLRKKPIQKIGEFDLYELVRPITRYLNINTLKFENAGIQTKKIMDDSIKEFKIEHAKGKISKLEIDSMRFDKHKLLCSNDIQIEIPSYTLPLKDGINTVRTGKIWLSTAQKKVKAENITYNSGRSMFETSKLYKTQKTIYNVKLDSAVFEQANIERLYDNKNFIASYGDLYGLKFQTYTNRKIKLETETKSSKSPLMLLKRAKFYWDIDSIQFHNTYFSYEELAPLAKRTGVVFIDSINGNLLNLNNDKSAEEKKLNFKVEASGRLFGDGMINAKMVFPLASKTDEYTISGTMDTLNMTKLNAYIEPTLLVSLKSGQLTEAAFIFGGDSAIAKGKIKMIYNNLKVNVLSKKESNSQKRLTSLFANTLIRKDNPSSKLSLPRVGQIYLKRPPQKSMVNFWMRAVMVGVKSTLGFDSKEGKKERKIEHREERKQWRHVKRMTKESKEEETDTEN